MISRTAVLRTLRYVQSVPSILYRNGVIHSPTDPFAEAILVADGQVAWLGSDDSVHAVLDGVDEVVDLDGALVAPAFVDAHAHVLETGFALTGLDLSPASGIGSLAQALDAIAAACRAGRAGGGGAPVLGHSWDESTWPEGRAPTRAELDQAAQGAPVYLTRIDMGSALVTTSFAEAIDLRAAAGWSDSGPVSGEADERARTAARAVTPARREDLYRSALRAAAAAGIVSLHEHSAPSLDTLDGVRALLDLTADPASQLPGVVAYRAHLCETSDDAREVLEAVPGLTGVGSDLAVDGTFGSRTAALRVPYADLDRGDPHGRGTLVLTAEQVANHVAAVTRAGSQATFHVTGDRAMEELLLGFRAASDVEGIAALRAAGHRVEHAEMVDAAAMALMVLFGLTASVQPAFDTRWGGPGSLYQARLGAARAAALNPFADLAGAGVPLAFGSDSPSTPFNPWGAVSAAIHHHEASQRISARAAFRAHTRGGWRAGRLMHTGAGDIRLGAPASLAIWQVGRLVVQAPDGRIAAWSTDPRAGTPLLPEVGPDIDLPICLRTLRDGVVLHDQLA